MSFLDLYYLKWKEPHIVRCSAESLERSHFYSKTQFLHMLAIALLFLYVRWLPAYLRWKNHGLRHLDHAPVAPLMAIGLSLFLGAFLIYMVPWMLLVSVLHFCEQTWNRQGHWQCLRADSI